MAQFFENIAKRDGQTIKFTSVATGQSVEFPAFITSFSDSFNINWGGGGTTFGRTDPVKSYQSTTRRIQASFDILGVSKNIAMENFKKYSMLIKMLYPVFSAPLKNQSQARTITGSPLMRIKYSNYIHSSKSAAGLLGCLQGVEFRPEYQAGHFLHGSQKDLIPLKYSMSFVFEPLHEEPLGTDPSGKFLKSNFPYKQDTSTIGSARTPATDTMGGAPHE